ncbi:hypothetical protein [Pseudodesulfovibrio sp.]|uniref:hypothetical protein n=1 Tax=Pseudodesulfovibrio sp. TaxID=2035812 RepID=UPI002619EE8F|nr:hypothetical protein [Pseudodesulfovibrio sp.]MDD3312893.1 hypothetical protein [Pseudodesulfovibrio sp.]
MKKKVLSAVALLLLSVSAAFAGDGLSAYLFNQADEVRQVDIQITCSSGAGAMPSSTVPVGGDNYVEFRGHDSEDQDWTFKVSSPMGTKIGEARFAYSGGKFSLRTIDEGITYDSFSDTELKLTITK